MTDVRKYCLAAICCLCIYTGAMARHITGGELSYRFLPGSSTGTSYKYEITLKLYRDCFSTGAQLDASAFITIYSKNASGALTIFENYEVNMTRRDELSLSSPGKCIDNPPPVCYQVGVYIFTATLPATPT